MTTETNKALVRRFFNEVVNSGRINAMDEIMSSDFVSHEALPPGISSGREGAKQLFSMLRSAFPDLHVVIEDEIAEGDKVVVRVKFLGTHQGDFMGFQPTGRSISYAVIDILRIADGLIVEHWAVSDDLGLMQQLSGETSKEE